MAWNLPLRLWAFRLEGSRAIAPQSENFEGNSAFVSHCLVRLVFEIFF